MNIEIKGSPIAYWGYEKARITNKIIEIRDNSSQCDNTVYQYHSLLTRLTIGKDKMPDNKVVFQIDTGDTIYYVQFWDNIMTIGTSIQTDKYPTWNKPQD